MGRNKPVSAKQNEDEKKKWDRSAHVYRNPNKFFQTQAEKLSISVVIFMLSFHGCQVVFGTVVLVFRYGVQFEVTDMKNCNKATCSVIGTVIRF